MIRKTLILASLLAFTACGAMAAENANVPVATSEVQQAVLPEKAVTETAKQAFEVPPPPCKKMKHHFENRLNLTDEQKAQAKALREKSHENIKPIFEQIKELKLERDAVLRSKMSGQMQQEKITEIDAKIKDLKKQAHELKMKNMKEFEKILTKKQKKELKKMKKEGRKKFEKARKECKKNRNCPSFAPKRPHPELPKLQPAEPQTK